LPTRTWDENPRVRLRGARVASRKGWSPDRPRRVGTTARAKRGKDAGRRPQHYEGLGSPRRNCPKGKVRRTEPTGVGESIPPLPPMSK
jgi:hypothetical protein